MWNKSGFLFKDTSLECYNFVTTKPLGNMRNHEVRKRFLTENNISCDFLTTAEQVHGNNVTVINKNNKGRHIPDTDGLITCEKGIQLAIFTADCLPVFFCAGNKAAGIVHAGWRGLANGILKNTIIKFENELNVKAVDLKASIGPHIQKCCYEVSKELKDIFFMPENETHLDLSQAAVNQLKEFGIKNISVNTNCTAHETELFFSFRADKTINRLMSFVEIK